MQPKGWSIGNTTRTPYYDNGVTASYKLHVFFIILVSYSYKLLHMLKKLELYFDFSNIKFEFLNLSWNLYNDGKNSQYQLLTFKILLKKRRYMIWQIQKIQKIKSSHMKLKPANIFLFQAPMLLASVSLIFQTWITSTTDSSK